MSRHQIPSRDNKHIVHAGWDGPLGTFFAQVYDTTCLEEDDGYMPVWRGAAPGDVISDAGEIVNILAPYAEVDALIVAQLKVDRLTYIREGART